MTNANGKVVVLAVLAVLLVLVLLYATNSKLHDQFEPEMLVISVQMFSEGPEKYSGSRLSVRGTVEIEEGIPRIAKLDTRFNERATIDPPIIIEDPLIFDPVSKRPQPRYSGCFDQAVAVSGRVGPLSNDQGHGIVQVETIFITDMSNIDGQLGSLCYANIDTDTDDSDK